MHDVSFPSSRSRFGDHVVVITCAVSEVGMPHMKVRRPSHEARAFMIAVIRCAHVMGTPFQARSTNLEGRRWCASWFFFSSLKSVLQLGGVGKLLELPESALKVWYNSRG